jgi:hypothetical protein
VPTPASESHGHGPKNSTRLRRTGLPVLQKQVFQNLRNTGNLHKNANRFVAVLLLPVSLLCSAHLGPDANWDLFNYHAYNGTALFRGRLFTDVAPAGIQTFLNPIFDIPTGAALLIGTSTLALSLVLALLQWLCWIAVWRLVREVMSKSESFPTLLATFLLAISGAAGVSLAFTSFNDWIVAGAVCEGLRGLVLVSKSRISPEQNLKHQAAFFSGTWFGIAAAIKLTAAPYVVAGLVVAAIFFGRVKFAQWLRGCILSSGLLCGPWAVYLWIRYQNPFFPFYNKAFKSTSALDANFKDVRFGARSIRDVTSFPIALLRGTSAFGELLFREWRFTAVFALFFVLILQLNFSKRIDSFRFEEYRVEILLAVFTTISFLPSIAQFGIYRYLVSVEITVSLLIALLMKRLVPKHTAQTIVLGIIFLSGFETAPNWGRDISIKAVNVPKIAKNSHLIYADINNSSYLSNLFPQSTRFASLAGFESGVLLMQGTLGDDLREFVAQGSKSGRLLVVVDPARGLPKTLGDLKISVGGSCEAFATPGGPRQLCPGVVSP